MLNVLLREFYSICNVISFIKVHVHPMNDGNGRIARLILHIILQCYNFPAIIIQQAKEKEYIDGLIAGQHGDLRPFLRLIVGYVHQTLEISIREGLPYPELHWD